MKDVIIIGAGPAGLSAAHRLSKDGARPLILEQDSRYIGGLARTVDYKGYKFDIGGHRFFSRVVEINQFWREILGDQFLQRKRLSRIWYKERFFHYPIEPLETFSKLGPVESLLCVLSYLRARIWPRAEARSFEDWIVNHFGTRLYRTFFKSYTEKVWGVSCTEISSDWAAQRIKGLSMGTLFKRALFGARESLNKDFVKTLIHTFYYPRLGPGQMWETLAERLRAAGCDLRLGYDVTRIHRGQGGVVAVEALHEGRTERLPCAGLVSSMPLRSLIQRLEPAAPPGIAAAAEELRYRDFLIVMLIIRQAELFPDNWIYIHDSRVQVARIQNFKNWSSDMVPDQGTTCLGMEYFCSRDEELWKRNDRELIELAAAELEKLGLCAATIVEDGAVVRVPKAYPVYDGRYAPALGKIKAFLTSELPNLQPAGRAGMHQYNNQDHAIMSGFMAANNLAAPAEYKDQWRLNQNAEYIEE